MIEEEIPKLSEFCSAGTRIEPRVGGAVGRKI